MSPRSGEHRLGAIVLGLLAVAFVAWRLLGTLSPAVEDPPPSITTGEKPDEPTAPGAVASLVTPALPSPTSSGQAPRRRAHLRPLERDPFRAHPAASSAPETPQGKSGQSLVNPATFHLDAIALGDGPALAIINGKVLGLGDLLEGARIASIADGVVTLEAAGDQIKLTMETATSGSSTRPEGKR